MQSPNTIFVANAGAGKTTAIVNSILNSTERSAVVTYTIKNCAEIKNKFYSLNGCVPGHTKVATWFSFLLSEFIRPYQNKTFGIKRVENIFFNNGISTPYLRKTQPEYYLIEEKTVYRDKISPLALLCNTNAADAVIKRLEGIYDHIYIDEFQDLSGYDLDVLELLLKSKIKITLVGDPRQSTYRTSDTRYNTRYLGLKIVDKFKEWQKKQLCHITEMNDCFRSTHEICNFADKLYPLMNGAVSLNQNLDKHLGVFIIPKSKVTNYLDQYSPQALRYSKATKFNFGIHTLPLEQSALNWGDCKGLTFERTLVFSMGALKEYLNSGTVPESDETLAKLYVALTRARFSVGLVHDGKNYFNLPVY